MVGRIIRTGVEKDLVVAYARFSDGSLLQIFPNSDILDEGIHSVVLRDDNGMFAAAGNHSGESFYWTDIGGGISQVELAGYCQIACRDVEEKTSAYLDFASQLRTSGVIEKLMESKYPGVEKLPDSLEDLYGLPIAEEPRETPEN